MSADPAASDRRDAPIAIVGIGCLFPGAPDLETYWANIAAGVDAIGPVPAGHSWSPDDYFDADPAAPDKTWCTRGGFLDGVPFDPLKFGIPPAMLESIDTTQLLSLIVAREALRDAGLDPDDASGAWDRDRVSVIIGITGTQEMAITAGARLQGPIWRRSLLRCGVAPALADVIVRDIANHFPTWTEQTFPGLLGNVVAGRIANRLDLGGTNAVVDAACASSLAALQYAIADLGAGRSDLVLTGGADTLNDIFMFECFTRTPAFSRAGDARPFDAAADGILIGEGIAITALKRLEDAERDGDRVYAVIRGLGSSSDGRYKSIYAPNPDGQAKALRRAYQRAGFGPDTVELVEAHGTGTKAGDVAEITALNRVYGETGREDRWAAVGSVKSQIGHTKSTAGAAGLVKAALALHQRVLPPTAKIERPNPKMGFDKSPFYLSPRVRPWIRGGEHPRRAAVSAFGFGGSNFHVVLEEHGAPSVAAMGPARAHLVLVGGGTHAEVIDQLRGLARIGAQASVAHAARASLDAWSPGRDHVVALVAVDEAELEARIGRAIARLGGDAPRPRDDVWIGGGAPAPSAWVYPGQGSQYVELGRELAVRYPVVRAALDAADASFVAAGLPRLSSRTFPAPAWSDADAAAQADALRATAWAQPAIGAASKGMTDLLAGFGLAPTLSAGHSYGELSALYAAGAFDADALWTASRERGRLMGAGDRDRGGMAAVDAPLDVIAAAIAADAADPVHHGDPAVLANRNHPEQGVISGSAAAVARVCERLRAAGRTVRALPVSAAFHSPLVADAVDPFRAALAGIPVGRLRHPVLGCATGAPLPTDDPDAVREHLAAALVQPVDWTRVVDGAWELGVRTFVEVGPRSVLAGLTERCLGDRAGATVLALDRHGDRDPALGGDAQLKRTLAALAASGAPLDPAPLLAERPPPSRRIHGPTTVSLAGANHRNPETLEPPMPKLPPPSTPAPQPTLPPAVDLGWAAVPSSGAPMAPPVHLERAERDPEPALPAAAPSPVPVAHPPPAGIAALLETTRATLAAFQDAQARTAEVHARFLDGVARANDNFARLFEAQTRLLERTTGSQPPALPMTTAPTFAALPPIAAAPSPAALAPSPSAIFAPTTPAPSPASVIAPAPAQPAALEAGRVPTPSSLRPAVATDLPPIFDAQAAVDKRIPGAAPALTAPGRPAGASSAAIEQAVLEAVAAKTGYPRAALEPAMDLESDLGIDSIKRVEILSAVRDAVPGLPELDNDHLASLRTVADVVGALRAALGPAVAQPSTRAAPQSVPVLSVPGRDRVVDAMLTAVAAKTGYPRGALELGMDLESDLGVDSIKRVEILSAVRDAVPGLPELDNDALARCRTLAEVVDALAEATAGPTEVPAFLVPHAPPARDVVTSALLDAVAAKTGFPRAALDLGMDLESDLGVDSIKRVEILSAVRERLPNLPELDADAASSLRRLADVADALHSVASGLGFALIGSRAAAGAAPSVLVPPAAPIAPAAPVPGLPPVQAASELLEPASDARASGVSVSLRRREVIVAAAPAARPIDPRGRWLVTADVGGALAREVSARLAAVGADVRVVDPSWNTDALDAALPNDAPVRGVVHLAAIGADGDTLRARVRGAFLIARAVGRAAAAKARMPRFVTVSQRGGAFGRAGAQGPWLQGALAGLPKTLAHEWSGSCPIALDVGANPDADAIVAELVTDRGVVEVGIADGGPITLATPLCAVTATGELPLQAGDLVVVTGGGRGVTAASVRALCAYVPLTVLLLGRTPLGPEPDWARGVPDAGLVGALLAGGSRTPRQAEAAAGEVRGAREIAATVRALDAVGARAAYASVDGRDRDAVRAAVADAVGRFGPVRGLVHGAGVLADKRVIDKTPDAFDRVLSTKLDGLEALLAAVDLAELRLCCAFTSVAGRYGNAGQCDYAMANEALVHRLLALRADAPWIAVKAIDWGPWDGGMVGPSLKAHFEAQGHRTIPLDAGARAFVSELTDGSAPEVVIEGPRPSSGEAVRALAPDLPWLVDHAINGRPVVPAAMVVEWMASIAAEVAPDRRISAIRDVEVLKGVVVDAPSEVTVAWTRPTADTVALEVVGAAAGAALGPVRHYRGVVELGAAAPAPVAAPPPNGLAAEPFPGSVADAYAHLFHGPRYQVITELVGISDEGAVAWLRPTTPDQLGIPLSRWGHTDPIVVDAALQLMLLWVHHKRGALALPTALGRLEWLGRPRGRVQVRLTMHDATAVRGGFSALFVDEDGAVVARLDGGTFATRTAQSR